MPIPNTTLFLAAVLAAGRAAKNLCWPATGTAATNLVLFVRRQRGSSLGARFGLRPFVVPLR